MKKKQPMAIENHILISVAETNLHQKIRNRTKPGHVYLITAEIHRVFGDNTGSEDVKLTIPTWVTNEGYSVIPKEQRHATPEHFEKNRYNTAESFIAFIIQSMKDNRMFIGTITRAVKITIIQYAGSIGEYYALRKLEEDASEFNIKNFVQNIQNGVYWVYDSSNRKKSEKQPAFMIIKQGGKYTIVDIDDEGRYTFTNNCLVDAIIARAMLNFGGTFSIKAVKR